VASRHNVHHVWESRRGREGRGELPGGATWGWQTKYLFTLDDDAFAHIDKSIRRVLTTEPTLDNHIQLYRASAGLAGRAEADLREQPPLVVIIGR
jgi:hypothetical protein